jgi:hypothetical protein
MGKLDVGEILAKKSATQKNIASMLLPIADIQSATKFLAEMPSFKGKGADVFQDYMRDQHVTYQNQMATALIDYNSTLESVQQAFIETVEETSETAKIYSGDLLTFVDDINKAKRGVEETVSAFNSAANTVKYIVDFTNPKDDHVVDALKSAAKSVNKTHDNYVEWSNNNKDQLDEYNDRFRKLMNAASTMSGISGQGIAGYSMSMKKLNKQTKGVARNTDDDNHVRVTAYENKYAKMRVVDVEKEAGIKKPSDMSASKYRQLSAYVQAQANAIPGLTTEQALAMAEKYFIALQGTKPADWPDIVARLNGGFDIFSAKNRGAEFPLDDTFVPSGDGQRILDSISSATKYNQVTYDQGEVSALPGTVHSVSYKAVDTKYEKSYGAVKGSVEAIVIDTSLGAKGYASFSGSNMGVGAEAKAEGAVASVKGETSLGSDDYNLHGEAEGNFAHGEAVLGAEVTSKGVEAEASAGAALLSGEVTQGATIGGVKLEVKTSGQLVDAQIGGKFHLGADSLDVGAKGGLLAGLGLEIEITW